MLLPFLILDLGRLHIGSWRCFWKRIGIGSVLSSRHRDVFRILAICVRICLPERQDLREKLAEMTRADLPTARPSPRRIRAWCTSMLTHPAPDRDAEPGVGQHMVPPAHAADPTISPCRKALRAFVQRLTTQNYTSHQTLSHRIHCVDSSATII